MIKILYVDDEPINLDLFKLTFKGKFEIITAESGCTALAILENEEIPIIISDMKMPGMNGLEFIKKAREKYNDKQYYILSGYEINAQIEEAMNKKLINNYFKKPFNRTLLEKEIKDGISG